MMDAQGLRADGALGAPAPDVRTRARAVTPRTAAVIARLLAEKADDRFVDAREVLEALA